MSTRKSTKHSIDPHSLNSAFVVRSFGNYNLMIHVLSCQPRVTVTSCFVYEVIRDLLSIDHLRINPIRRIGLILKWSIDKLNGLKRDSIYNMIWCSRKKGFRHLFTLSIKALTYTDVPAGLAHFMHSASIFRIRKTQRSLVRGRGTSIAQVKGTRKCLT